MDKKAISKVQTTIILVVIVILVGAIGAAYIFMQKPAPQEQPPEQPQEEVIELEWWDGITGGEGPVLDELVEKFHQEYGDKIHITRTTMAWSDLYAKLMAAYEAGTGLPDILMCGHEQVPRFRDTVFTPLDEYMNGPDGVSEEVFTSAARGVLEWQKERYGHIYATPYSFWMLGMYVNLNALEDANMSLEDFPKDHEEFVQWGLTFKERTGKYAIIHGWSMWPWGFLQPLLIQRGLKWYTIEDGKYVCHFDEPEVVETVRWMQNLAKLGLTPSEANWEVMGDTFITGEAACLFFGTWMQSQFDLVEELNYTVLPYGYKDMPGTLAGTHAFELTGANGKERTDAAWTVIKWLLKPENDGRWCEYGGHVPSIAEAVNYPGYTKSPNRQAFAAFLDYCAKADRITSGFIHERAADVDDVINSRLQSLMLLEVTPEECCRQIDEGVQAIFDEISTG